MDFMLIGVELISGFFELVIAVAFLILSYKFATLAKHYKVEAFKYLSLGFRFIFVAYFVPVIGVFIGSIFILEPNEYFELVFAGLPYLISMAIAFMFFFKSIKAVIKYANA